MMRSPADGVLRAGGEVQRFRAVDGLCLKQHMPMLVEGGCWRVAHAHLSSAES